MFSNDWEAYNTTFLPIVQEALAELKALCDKK